MKRYFRVFSVVVLLLAGSIAGAQEYDGFKARGSFKPYDKTYISPGLKGKHSVSFGIGLASVSPLKSWNPEPGMHLGYNYILLYKRKRVFGIKEVWRDEVKMGFGVHLDIWKNKEWYFSFNYLNPLFGMRGKIISVYFFNEFGIGLHRAPEKMEDPAKVRFNVTLEPIRIRFGKTPLNWCFKAYYDAGSALLSKERMDLAFSTSLRYYFYKNYKKK